MPAIFPYINGNQTANIMQFTKGTSDRPSFIVDFTDGLRTTASTISTAACVSLGSTGSTVTTIAGTTTVSGNTVIVDMKTGGSSGTGDATNGDQFQIRLTATLSTAGPLYYDVYVKIANPSYAPT